MFFLIKSKQCSRLNRLFSKNWTAKIIQFLLIPTKTHNLIEINRKKLLINRKIRDNISIFLNIPCLLDDKLQDKQSSKYICCNRNLFELARKQFYAHIAYKT